MIWRVVPSCPFLEASDEGLIRLIPYEGAMPNGSLRTYGGKERKGSWDGNRYVFAIKGRKRTYRVARLVCEAFHGSAPAGKPYVLHRDENSRNNRADNLCWGTQKENLNAPGFIAYCKGRTGDNHPYRKGRKKNEH